MVARMKYALTIVNAVSAYDDERSGKTILLAVWEDHGDQAEALINIHAIRENNVVVHNFAQ